MLKLGRQRRETTAKGSWVDIRTGRDHSPITVTGKGVILGKLV